MRLQPCSRCGKIFAYVTKSVCPSCIQQEEESFEKVKEFIREYPLASVDEISKETDVNPKLILKFVREGRLIPTKGLATALRCRECGAAITSGTYCVDCTVKLQQKINSAYQKEPSADSSEEPSFKRSAKMHIKPKKSQ